MKIKCLSNKKINLEEKKPIASNSNLDLAYEFLDVGNVYVVYGMVVDAGQIWYYICDQVHDFFPIPRPATLFAILDNRLSRYWVFAIIEGYKRYPFLIFPEWVEEPYFQDKLTDGEEREVNIFKAYKELMDLEFPDPSISDGAQIVDSNWLMCPDCIDAWKSNNEKDGMVRCPKCNKIMHNPRYKNKRIKPY